VHALREAALRRRKARQFPKRIEPLADHRPLARVVHGAPVRAGTDDDRVAETAGAPAGIPRPGPVVSRVHGQLEDTLREMPFLRSRRVGSREVSGEIREPRQRFAGNARFVDHDSIIHQVSGSGSSWYVKPPKSARIPRPPGSRAQMPGKVRRTNLAARCAVNRPRRRDATSPRAGPGAAAG